MANPTMTFNAKGNILSNFVISGNFFYGSGAIDASTKYEVQVQVEASFGTISGGAGIQVDAFRQFGAGPTNDTIPMTSFVIGGSGSTIRDQSFALPTGKYLVKLTNL